MRRDGLVLPSLHDVLRYNGKLYHPSYLPLLGVSGPLVAGDVPTSPYGVSGAVGRWKANAITGKVNGDPISQWDDFTGLGNHGVQGTGGNQPTYRATDGPSSTPCVRFVTDDWLDCGSGMGKPANYTVFAVILKPSVATGGWFTGSLSSGGASATSWGALTNRVGYSFGDNTNYSDGATTATILTDSVWAIIAARYISGATSCTIWKDGASQAVTTVSTAASSCGGTAHKFSLGRAGEFAGLYLSGDFADTIVFNRNLSDGEMGTVFTGLNTDYVVY